MKTIHLPDCLEKWSFRWWNWGQLLREQETQKNLEEYEGKNRSQQWGEKCPIFIEGEVKKAGNLEVNLNTYSYEELEIKLFEVFSRKAWINYFLNLVYASVL